MVSTIHKAKGREFDAVHLLIGGKVLNDEERRMLYVGLTRAKNELYIHYGGDTFDAFAQVPGVTQSYDTRGFSEPDEILLQMGHRDVVLDFFKGKREVISNLRSGQRLSFRETYLTAETRGRTVTVAKLSKAGAVKLRKWREKGYEIEDVTLRFVVLWKGAGDDQETPIILPDVRLVVKGR